MSRMFDRFDKNELAVGTILLAPNREIVEVAGYGGLDFVTLDMMVSPLDWDRAAQLVLAAERFNVTPWLRLSSYPWGESKVDPSLPAQVLRGLSIGAECVLASVNTAKQVEAMLHPLSNPHRRLYVRHDAEPRTAAQRAYDEAQSPQWVVPIIESGPALDNLDQLLAVDGLKMIYLGMGDLTKALGKSDEHDPEVRAAVSDVVSRAKKQDVRIAVNTLGYGPDTDFADQVAGGVKALGDAGVAAALTPRPTLALQRYYEKLLRGVRSE